MIRLDQVSYRYPNQSNFVLKDFQLQINASDLVLISGDNGTGKSTLLRIIAGLIPKFSGGVFTGSRVLEEKTYDTVDSSSFGVLLSGIEQQFIQSRVDQEFFYILENRGLTKEEINSRWEMLMDYFKLEKLASREIQTLSSGETQLVKLALAFALLPRILLMDEPLSHLDESAKKHVFGIFQDLRKKLGMTFIIADHDVSIWSELGTKLHHVNVSQIQNQSGVVVPPKNTRIGEVILEMSQLHYGNDSRVIISGMNRKIAKGECIVVKGGNGSGKTTLLRLMSGQYRPTSGSVQSAPSLVIKMLANPVHMNFFSQKVREEYQLDNIDIEASQHFDTSNWLDRYVHDLSQGEQRKVAFNLLNQRKVDLLLLDEPFLHLDAHSSTEMLQMIANRLSEGMSVVITSHELEKLEKIANQIWELS